MVKRSIEQDLRTRTYEARNGRIESNMLVTNQSEQRHVLKGRGSGKPQGSAWKGNTCSFQHDTNKRVKTTTQPALSLEHPQSQDVQDSAKAISPSGRRPSGNSLACHARTIWNVLARILFCEQWQAPEGSFYKSAEGCTFGDKCVFAHRRAEEQPTKRCKRSVDQSAVALLKDTKFWLYLSTWRHQDHHRFCGRAQPRRNHSDVSDFLQHSTPKPVAQ